MAYLWDLISVRITIETAGGELISARVPQVQKRQVRLDPGIWAN
jgi:hypothetical protein